MEGPDLTTLLLLLFVLCFMIFRTFYSKIEFSKKDYLKQYHSLHHAVYIIIAIVIVAIEIIRQLINNK